MRRRKYKKQRNIIIVSIICLSFIMITGYSAFSTKLSIGAKGNVVDKSRVIKSWRQDSNEDFHTDFYRENIVSATLLNSAKVPSGAKDSWDVSASKDGGVMAYVVESSTETGKYDLFIGAKDGVIANEYSNHLFYKFSNLKSIDFDGNYDTSNVISMEVMFNACKSLTSLDVSSFDTSKVRSMRDMFSSCVNLEEIKLGDNFDTSNVTDMWAMFYNDGKLTSIDVSGFNTSNVTIMWGMFAHDNNLKQLDLCSFDTAKVADARSMFFDTSSLSKIKVGSGWNMNSADITNMFDYSGVSSVTTGECGI